MVEGSVVWFVATLAGNTAIIASALCRSVSAVNTNCLNTVEFGHWHADARHIRRAARLVPLESAAQQVLQSVVAHNRAEASPRADFIGTPNDVVGRCAPYVEMGNRHLIFRFLAPFDAEIMERLAHEVRPRLQDIDDAASSS